MTSNVPVQRLAFAHALHHLVDLSTQTVPRSGIGLNELLGGGTEAVTTNRNCLKVLVKCRNQRFAAGNCVLDRW